MIIHDNSIKKIVEHRKNELNENIDTYVQKLYPNIGTYTIFEFHYVHTDNIRIKKNIKITKIKDNIYVNQLFFVLI